MYNKNSIFVAFTYISVLFYFRHFFYIFVLFTFFFFHSKENGSNIIWVPTFLYVHFWQKISNNIFENLFKKSHIMFMTFATDMEYNITSLYLFTSYQLTFKMHKTRYSFYVLRLSVYINVVWRVCIYILMKIFILFYLYSFS